MIHRCYWSMLHIEYQTIRGVRKGNIACSTILLQSALSEVWSGGSASLHFQLPYLHLMILAATFRHHLY